MIESEEEFDQTPPTKRNGILAKIRKKEPKPGILQENNASHGREDLHKDGKPYIISSEKAKKTEFVYFAPPRQKHPKDSQGKIKVKVIHYNISETPPNATSTLGGVFSRNFYHLQTHIREHTTRDSCKYHLEETMTGNGVSELKVYKLNISQWEVIRERKRAPKTKQTTKIKKNTTKQY